MRIRTRIYLSAVVSVILVVAIVLITFVTSNTLEEKRSQHEIAHRMQEAIYELDALTYQYLLNPEVETEDEWTTLYHSTAADVGEDLAQSIRADYAAYGDLFTDLITNQKEWNDLIYNTAPLADIMEVQDSRDDIIPQLLSKSRKIIAESHAISEASFESLISTEKFSRNFILWLAFGSALAITLISMLVARSISVIMRRLNEFTAKVAEGENELLDEIEGKHPQTQINSDVNAVVDQLVKMQGALARSERMATLGQFSGNISHELRNPLGVIDSSVYFLKMKLKDADAKVIEHLDRIKSSVDNSTAIIESLLNLTRMKSPDLSPVDVGSMVRDSVTTSKLPESVAVTFDLPEQPLVIRGDHEQLRMALKNIIKNANDAMEGEGTLRVTVRDAGEGLAEIILQDSGPGIDPADIEKVFLPLFTKKVKGIGFGLSITQMVIEKHNGTIEARSEPGGGAEFSIKLPMIVE